MTELATQPAANVVPASAGGLRGLPDLIDVFLTDIDVKPASRATYRRQLRQLERFLADTGRLPDFQNRQLGRADLLAYRDWLTAGGLSSLTVGGYLTATRQFFDWLTEYGVYPAITQRVKNPKQPQGHMRDTLTGQQVRAVLEAIDTGGLEGLRDYALVNLLARTGLRTVEIARATLADIRQQGGQWVLFVQGKGRDTVDQFVILTPEAYSPLKSYLDGRLAFQPASGKPACPLFTSLSNRNKAGFLTTRSVSRIVKERFQAVGLDSSRLTAHSLRHTAATLALAAGADLLQVQAMLRHADPKTTQKYVHNLQRLTRSAEATITF